MIYKLGEKQLKRLTWIKLSAFLGVLVAGLLIVLHVENMLLSTILAFVISYLLGPLVNSLERAGVERWLSTLAVFFVSGLLIFLFFFILSPFAFEQLSSLRDQLPMYIEGTIRLIQESEVRFAQITGSAFLIDFSGQVESFLLNSTRSLFEDLPQWIRTTFTLMILSPFLAFFMIKDGKQLTRSLLALVPNSQFELTLNLYHQINVQMGQFVRARLLEGAIIGVVTGLGLFLIGFPFAALLGLFAAVMNLIPYLGPILGGVPALVIALVNGDSALVILLAASVYFLAQMIDAFVIIPLVVAKIVDLHPVTVMVAIIVGAQVMGILGMIISIPVASALKVTLGTIYNHLTDFRV